MRKDIKYYAKKKEDRGSFSYYVYRSYTEYNKTHAELIGVCETQKEAEEFIDMHKKPV